MRNSRLIGGKPKIGIRPIIDGRRGGIRESLEDMTMAMAHKVAELYSSVLRHSDGTSVECVIADTTIGGVAEAAMAAALLFDEDLAIFFNIKSLYRLMAYRANALCSMKNLTEALLSCCSIYSLSHLLSSFTY